MNITNPIKMFTMKNTNPCENDNKTLGMDQACFTVFNNNNVPISLFSTNEECYYKLVIYLFPFNFLLVQN